MLRIEPSFGSLYLPPLDSSLRRSRADIEITTIATAYMDFVTHASFAEAGHQFVRAHRHAMVVDTGRRSGTGS